ncbi:hypothetical protein PFICI_09346 [Pestalotiopsis fici W106-1]|uniref:Uncharacterized protein n=1 Tax=Pestalotiopsis fici (strain W106-1 / CGMCC3.15140) TaxID=1229662 RepID=W3X029_PESFW|nr:uncharacterized protein PFICI_09346 [Pestalotiopsis fici W106-1]ETS79493.1 hypothetical protein PFICI_09346 [Pestalotiopsis fici W106-1]
MDKHVTQDELDARARIQDALKKANDPSNPITDLTDFLLLAKRNHLAPAVYEKYERTIIDMWYQQRNARPPSPAASTARDSLDSKVSDAPGDSPKDLPSLDPEAQIRNAWIVHPISAEFKYAKYKQWDRPGNYIRADTLKNNDLRGGEEEFVVHQWDLDGPSGTSNNSDDNAAAHTAFRVVSKYEADRIKMDVDIVFGTDWRDNLEDQAFGVHVVRRASRRLSDITEQGLPTSTLLAGSSLSQQQPSIARLEAPPQHVININGPIILAGPATGPADLAAILNVLSGTGYHPATHRAATGLPGNAALGPGVTEMDVPKIPEGSRNKRKMADDHEPRSRDRTERLQG